MRNYVKPSLETVEFSVEERFAGSVCTATGICFIIIGGKKVTIYNQAEPK